MGRGPLDLREIKVVSAWREILQKKESLMRSIGAGFLLLFLGLGLAIAQDVEAGHRLAAMWCSGCHPVEAHPSGPMSDAVPSFAAVARMPSTTRTFLNVFLSAPHFAMPNFSLSRQEIADVSSYILSLRPAEQQN